MQRNFVQLFCLITAIHQTGMKDENVSKKIYLAVYMSKYLKHMWGVSIK